jgi:16S rRNA G966 N2-methylase RsmD
MIYPNDFIFNTPCKILKLLSSDEKGIIAEQIVKYYRAVGFPYYSLTIHEMQKILDKLYIYNTDNLILTDYTLQQNMLGLNLANMFHPQMWEVKCGNSKTPMEIFLDDALFKKAILKRIEYSDTKLQPFNIRKSLKVFGAQSVSNFRPTIAKWVYENFSNNGIVLDPCMGYGGRLLGACSCKIERYIGIDPDINQYRGNIAMIETITDLGFKVPKIFLYDSPFEDFSKCLSSSFFDLVFTSPPYFNKEKYSNDSTQSWIRYPVFSDWLDKFLYVLVDESFRVLKQGGYLVLNVSDSLANYLCTYIGESPTFIWNMRLSNIIGRRNNNKESHKTEKILIWKK